MYQYTKHMHTKPNLYVCAKTIFFFFFNKQKSTEVAITDSQQNPLSA